ncbi:cytochrome P450 family protein [Streptomyces sp. CB02923]|uniref:cytochrome P450 family protein n=1 Tax=Streptomyces sp. CB02923 TaxID=1718985 RepID=UPI0009A0E11E|nr:cytochrome P450 [Streptomyces sp. CB02923]
MHSPSRLPSHLTSHPPAHPPLRLPEPLPLYGADYKRDPYPLYAELRERGPVHRVRFPSGVCAWLITGYEAAHQALNDPRLGKHHSRGNAAWRDRASIMPEPQHSQLQVHLLHQDPPRHTSMRRLITDAFAPKRIAELRPRFEQLADALLDELPPAVPEHGGSIDLVASFAARFPFLVLAEVIGLPDAFTARFDRDWGKVVQPVGPDDPGRPAYEARLRGLQGYIAGLVRHKRQEPGADLLSRLVTAHDEGALDGAELDSMIFQLLVAGQEPVTNQITTALTALLRHTHHTHPPHRPRHSDHSHPHSRPLAALRDNPALLPRAVDELLRYDSAFELTTWRFLAEDADVSGTRIPAGDSVIVSLCAANRDPARFPAPDTLMLDRSPNPHLAFGHGIHFCPGATLARTELHIALETLLRRLPNLRLAVPDSALNWVPAVLARGVSELPVTYGPVTYGSPPVTYGPVTYQSPPVTSGPLTEERSGAARGCPFGATGEAR